jgi:acyl-CoA synthetase (AMP-forming)/AMP-acid ligase II
MARGAHQQERPCRFARWVSPLDAGESELEVHSVLEDAMQAENDRILKMQRDCSTMMELLQWRAAVEPDRAGFTFLEVGELDGPWLTYAELDRWARATAATMQAMAPVGARVLILLPPGLDYLVTLFGSWYAGMAAVPYPVPGAGQSVVPLQTSARTAEPALVVTCAALRPRLEPAFGEDPMLRHLPWLEVETIAPGAASGWRAPAVPRDSLACLLLTSGSTSTPKGVMRSHATIMDGTELVFPHLGHTAQSTVVSWIPLYTGFGVDVGIARPLYGGFPAILLSPDGFADHPAHWLQVIAAHRATHSAASNFAYDLVARTIAPEIRAKLDLSSWEVAWIGGERIRPETIEFFSTVFAPCGFRRAALYPMYGMAEMMMISVWSPGTPPVIRSFDEQALERAQVIPVTEEGAGTLLVSCGVAMAGQPI